LEPGDNVLIQGAGTLGIYAVALARSYGCNKIIVTDVIDKRLGFIKKFGATDVINVKGMKDEEVIKAVQDLTRGFGVDIAMEVAGLPGIIPLGLKCLHKGVSTSRTGMCSRERILRTMPLTSSFASSPSKGFTIMVRSICNGELIFCRGPISSTPLRIL
jgi:threonine dehydrogenase-like Zn-dependent dehydrogenase